MTKKEIRKQFLEKRKALSESECAMLNQALYSNFFASVDLSFVRVLHIFLSIPNNQEPDTWPLLDRIRREFPHIRMSVPKVVGDHLENFFFEGLHQLHTSSWGIQEPKQGVPTPTDKIDIVIVPLLAVDERGHRVGYGRGYYDRLLKTTRKDCLKVGLSFFSPVKEIEDITDQDVRLNQCVTPEGTLAFPIPGLMSGAI